ncbi:porphobilinogen synthase [Calditerrivibrio nitroreducens]|uniref:Delta-aminolevulinic acid dehydratase n=1 Tax=Calditerrivibrio nitroreducens (strain DSM 19672 / NBRC 101217 / Yu37-1) TaxID=768670 RepID=E4TJ59_CALNY|nr:porphobilinogen synthase [Calditerrivibrio nitroreducens]ADR18095.1 porphobilinogen synthase [Calditerrivibrio nitroreducens DSM 19672]
MAYPIERGRRLRRNEKIRRMVRETVLSLDDLIYPLFVVEGEGIKKEVSSMPDVYQMSIDNIVKECIELERLGLQSIILFGIPNHKDELGSEAYNDNGVIQQAIRAIKQNTGLYIITDVCMCEYTSHGHCGIIKDGDVDNDTTLKYLAMEALSHAKAGADMVAPSDMMDGRVAVIRDILDDNGFEHIPIMSYSVKYASAFYGPFREAAESTPQFGDRRSYQMDPANRREALREARYDLEEGADILMVKPALPYLDIIRDLRETFDLPIAAYNVSGEYSMIMAAVRNGWVDKDRVIMESLTSIKRAGADLILTYFAKEVARILG